MSNIFKTKAVVLKKEKLSKGDILYTVFSCEYGKFLCSKRANTREKELELGAVFSSEISVKEKRDIHSIRYIKIKNEFNYTNLSFNLINSYLFLISDIEQNCKKSMIIPEIVNIVEIINKREKIEEYKIVLARLKLKEILGNLNLENNDNTIKKILTFISKNNFKDIVRLGNPGEKIERDLLFLIK